MDIAYAVKLEVKISLIFCSVIVEAWGPFHKTLMPFLHLKCQYMGILNTSFLGILNPLFFGV